MAPATLTSSSLLLFTSAAGAGLLSYPYAALQQGVALNAALTLAFAGTTVFTVLLLAQTAALVAAHARPGFVAATFEELCFRALGLAHYKAGVTAVLVGVLGALIGYLIVIGDVLCPVAEHLAGGGGGGGGGVPWFASRPFVVMAFAVLVALPLSSVETLHGLKGTAALAGASVLAVGVLVVRRGAQAGFGVGGVEAVSLAAPGAADAPGAAQAPLVLARLTFVNVAMGVPISIFSLGCHCQVVPCLIELAPELRRLFLRPLLASVAACVLLYTLTGAFGYAAFREATKGDVLLNFPVSADAVSDAAKGLLGVHIVLAYPVLLWPGRKSIATLLLALANGGAAGGAGGGGGGGDGDGGDGGDAPSPAPRSPLARAAAFAARSTLAQSAALVLTTAALAVGFPEVAVVFGLVGATSAAFEIFYIPGMLALRWADALETSAGKGGAGAGEGAGAGDEAGDSTLLLPPAADAGAAPAFAPYGDAWGAADTRALWAGAAARLGEGRQVPAFLPRSPAVLRASGWAMIAFGWVVGIGSTGSYVYSTWIAPH